jgi:hypothetical protein
LRQDTREGTQCARSASGAKAEEREAEAEARGEAEAKEEAKGEAKGEAREEARMEPREERMRRREAGGAAYLAGWEGVRAEEEAGVEIKEAGAGSEAEKETAEAGLMEEIRVERLSG